MDFLILTVASLVSIALLSLVAKKLFPEPAGLSDNRVRRNMIRYEPEADIASVLISADAQVAIVVLNKPVGTYGLLRQLGDRVVCRLVTQGGAEKAEWNTDSVSLFFNDFTQPALAFTFAPDQRRALESAVGALAPKAETSHAA